MNVAQKDNHPTHQADTPDGEEAVYGTQNWPSSLFRSDRVCPLPHNPRRQPRPFTDWAAI
jgi:hypothetical protein